MNTDTVVNVCVILTTALIHGAIAFGAQRARIERLEELAVDTRDRLDDHLQNHLEGIA